MVNTDQNLCIPSFNEWFPHDEFKKKEAWSYKSILRHWQICFSQRYTIENEHFQVHCEKHVFNWWNGFEFLSLKWQSFPMKTKCCDCSVCTARTNAHVSNFLSFESMHQCSISIWQFQCSIKSYKSPKSIREWHQFWFIIRIW